MSEKDIKRQQAQTLRKQYFNEEAEELLRRFSEALNEKQIMFEPTEEMVKTIKMFAPRKVFTY